MVETTTELASAQTQFAPEPGAGSFKRLLGRRRLGTGATFTVLHIGERSRTRCKAQLRVEPPRIACQQADSPESLKLGVGQHCLGQPCADAPSAMALGNDHVRPIGVGREVGDGPPESDQRWTVENGEADGILKCPGEYLGCQRTAPVRRAKQSEYGSVIEVLTVGGQAERAASDLDGDILHELTILGGGPVPRSVLSLPLSSRARRSFPLRWQSTPSARRRPATWHRRRGSPCR